MVNKRVYNYLVKNSKQYNLKDLTKKLVDSGYDINVVNEAVNVFQQKTNTKSIAVKNLPEKKIVKKPTTQVVVQKQVEQSNQIKPTTQVVVQEQVKQSNQVEPTTKKEIVKPKKSKKWLWILFGIFFLLLIAAGVYYFFFR
jgi:ATP-dependent Zn protease